MKNVIELLKKYSLLLLVLHLILVITGSLWPSLSEHYQTGEISSGQTPKEGDNFKIANDPIVYRLEDGKRRQYKSDTAFFNNSHNKPFDTPYEQGGILICDKEVVLAFSIGNYMPKKVGGIGELYWHKSVWEQLKKGIFRRDKLSHFFAYAVLAILLLMSLEQYSRRDSTIKYIAVLVFGIVFGAVIEQLQFEYIPGRDKELLDLVFNTLGIFAGIFIYNRWVEWLKSKAVKSRTSPA
jgi:VanZ family protein